LQDDKKNDVQNVKIQQLRNSGKGIEGKDIAVISANMYIQISLKIQRTQFGMSM